MQGIVFETGTELILHSLDNDAANVGCEQYNRAEIMLVRPTQTKKQSRHTKFPSRKEVVQAEAKV